MRNLGKFILMWLGKVQLTAVRIHEAEDLRIFVILQITMPPNKGNIKWFVVDHNVPLVLIRQLIKQGKLDEYETQDRAKEKRISFNGGYQGKKPFTVVRYDDEQGTVGYVVK